MREAIVSTTGQALRRRWRAVVRRVRQRGRSAAYRAARMAGASVAAFLVAQAGLPGPDGRSRSALEADHLQGGCSTN
jgi:hypothetical protein